MSRKKALRGLSAFIGSGEHQFDDSLMKAAASGSAESGGHGLRTLGVDQLRRGRYQPREDIPEDYVREMADSIKEVGIIEPIVVRLSEGDTPYEILAGEIRWRAAQLAGLADVPVVVREVDDRTAAAIALIENLQRKDLNPIEEARGICQLRDEFGLTQAQVAEALGRSQPSISRILALLDVEPVVQEFIRKGELEASHAAVLQGLRPDLQQKLARQAATKGWSVRELERQKGFLQVPVKPAATDRPDPNVAHLEQYMQTRLSAPVRLRYNANSGKGKIEIPFSSLDECNGVLERLGMLPEED